MMMISIRAQPNSHYQLFFGSESGCRGVQLSGARKNIIAAHKAELAGFFRIWSSCCRQFGDSLTSHSMGHLSLQQR